MSNIGYELLFLDFDGVIADSTRECVALTWFAGKDIEHQTLRSLLNRVPASFDRFFRSLRAYSRTLDDFAVARLIDPRTKIDNLEQFKKIKLALNQDTVDNFVYEANRLREVWRTLYQPDWINAHTIFNGITELFSRYSGRIYVVTAKDAPSTREILVNAKLDQHVAEIFGEARDKRAVITEVCSRKKVSPEHALFIDDNLKNVAEAARSGINVRWATWGWVPDEHHTISTPGAETLNLEHLTKI